MGKRRSSAGTIGEHKSKAPLPTPLPVLRCGEREPIRVVVARCVPERLLPLACEGFRKLAARKMTNDRHRSTRQLFAARSEAVGEELLFRSHARQRLRALEVFRGLAVILQVEMELCNDRVQQII